MHKIRTTQINTNKCIENILSKPTTTSLKKEGIDKYANAHSTICAEYTNNIVVIEFSSRLENEPSTSGTFDKADKKSVIIQSALCEVASEEKSHGLSISIVSRIENNCVIIISNKQLLLYTLHKLETVKHINSAYNKESLIESKHKFIFIFFFFLIKIYFLTDFITQHNFFAQNIFVQ